MEENTQHFWHSMLYYFKKFKNVTEKKMICAVYGEGAETYWMHQKWFVKFSAGDFLLDDAPQLGRPVEVDSNQMKTLIEDNQCSTTWDIANILKISKSIKLLVKMKSVFRFMEKTIWTFWLTQYFGAFTLFSVLPIDQNSHSEHPMFIPDDFLRINSWE